MPNQLFSNNAITTLGSSLSSSATTLTVSTGTGVLFRSPTGVQYFLLTLFAAGSTSGTPNEIVKVTSRTGDTMVIVRAQEGTTALNWSVGDNVSDQLTQGTMENLSQVVDTQAQAGNWATDSGSANAGAITLTPAPASLAAIEGAPIRVLKVNSANTGAYTLNVNGLGATAVVLPPNTALIGGEFGASGWFQVVYDGTRFQVQSAYNLPVRIRLLASTSFFVNASTGNDSNNGLTSGTPWLTLLHAWNYVRDNYDLNGQTVTISCAGNFTTGASCSGRMTGQANSTSVIFNGTGGASIAVNGAGFTCFSAVAGAQFQVQNLAVGSIGANSACLESNDGGAAITIGAGMSFTASSGGAHKYAASGQIITTNAYSILGGNVQHDHAAGPGAVISYFPTGSGTITLTGTPAFTEFALAENTGGIFAPSGSVLFSGAATGSRYVAQVNGIINTQGGGANFLPGNSAGSQPTGGQYV